MRLSFAIKVPVKERFKLLWHGGLYVEVQYGGQHKIAHAKFTVINKRDVDNNANKNRFIY